MIIFRTLLSVLVLLVAWAPSSACASVIAGVARRDVSFPCGETRCAAWLYLPEGVDHPPVVVMAHGFGATRGMLLPRFAERFAAKGLAVFLFDYRYLGASGGEPRQIIDPELQIEDWHSAIAHVRTLSNVDHTRLGLWGTSFSGGHVIAVAAEDAAVRAVVAQVPFVGMDDRSERPPLGRLLHLLTAASWDSLRGALGLSPYYLPLTGREGSGALMIDEGSYEKLVEPGSKDTPLFRNEVAARVLWSLDSYKPGQYAAQVRCPILFVPARGDTLVSVASVEAVAAQAPQGQIEVVEVGHYDIYVEGATFEHVVQLEAELFLQHLTAP